MLFSPDSSNGGASKSNDGEGSLSLDSNSGISSWSDKKVAKKSIISKFELDKDRQCDFLDTDGEWADPNILSMKGKREVVKEEDFHFVKPKK